jgi:DnaJ-class molecular chaperone
MKGLCQRQVECPACKGTGTIIVAACKHIRCWVCLGRGLLYVGDFKPKAVRK